jgi:hypothetical protein
MEKMPLHAVHRLAPVRTESDATGSAEYRRFHESAQNRRRLRYADRRRFCFGMHEPIVINRADNILPVGIGLRNIEWFL